jgi:nitrite reductase/ring-hydroxylating ferredoxin subunit
MADRPLKAVRLLGQDLVLFRDAQGRFGLLDRDCPHRGADLKYARHEGDGIRCPFHGWKFDAGGRCLETPAEPMGSTLCQRVRQRSYPLRVAAGVLFAWLGPDEQAPPELPAFDCFRAPATHSFAFKGLWRCNWLQAFEVGIDPSHASFLHRMLDEDVDPAHTYGRQFRGASVGTIDGERWPMTRVLRECASPEIRHEELAPGLTRLTTLRLINDKLTHVRITNAAFPHTFVIPLSETVTITQMHVPVDDVNTYWYSFFTSFDAPLDKETMRAQRLVNTELPDYLPKKGRDNDWGYSAEEQRTRTYLGMGEQDINVHDQWACESMGAIQDRTREHLGTSDKVIMANRRVLLKAIETVRAGGTPPMVLSGTEAAALTGPDTIDCIAPAQGWETFWRDAAAAKRRGAAWLASAEPAKA